MKRLLTLVTLLVALSTATYAQFKPVAHGVIRNVVTSLPSTTLTLPPTTGQFRLSVNATLTQRDAFSHTTTILAFNYTDSAGIEIISLPALMGNAAPPYASTGFVVPITTAKDTPITITISKDGVDKSIITIYWTLELLQPTLE